MAGISDSAFRQLCYSFGADVVYTEMTSIDGLYYKGKTTLELLDFNHKKEGKVVLQLFGKRPELIKKAVERVEEAGFDGIDINFGCPAKKVVAHEGGITLLRDLNLAQEIVHATVESASIPVSIKTRISINKKDQTGKITVFDFLDKIKDYNVSALMLHGRTYEQGFSGSIDFDSIKLAKEKFKGVVLGNGGLNTPEDIKEMLDKTGVDGVGLARGLYGKPWLFKQINDYLQNGKYSEFDLEQIKKVALKHAKLLSKSKNDKAFLEIRKHLCWYLKGFPGASDWRAKLVRVENLSDVKKTLKQLS